MCEDYKDYMECLKIIQYWSGALYGYKIPNGVVPLSRVKDILVEARIWYDGTDRPMVCEYRSFHC